MLGYTIFRAGALSLSSTTHRKGLEEFTGCHTYEGVDYSI